MSPHKAIQNSEQNHQNISKPPCNENINIKEINIIKTKGKRITKKKSLIHKAIKNIQRQRKNESEILLENVKRHLPF